ncbi:hypothetical protein N9A49_02760 [Salibacteraceae bacterium]|jgi:hypothetical protein|nr:hypothetical protein [Salibacteraceae bacterium]MDB4104013.1 hypothetical protein [Salibacteraceae bacterium]MDB9709249.1 hypothetical protein [Salibacteraceae bacterium]HAQ71988.1 hypothetical protein [Flavobacteriales bacterium]
MKFKYLLFIGLIVSIASCSGDDANKEAESVDEPIEVSAEEELIIGADGWVEYDHKEYSVFAPQDWEMDVTGRMNTTFILFSPRDSKNDMFRENVNLVKEDISKMDMTLFDYVKNSEGVLEKYMSDLRDLNIEQKGERYWLTYTATQERMDLYFVQMIELNEGVIYILTYTSNDQSISVHADNGKKIIERFQFNGFNL